MTVGCPGSPRAYLTALGLAVAYAVFRYGGVLAADWHVCAAALGMCALVFWLRATPRDPAPPLGWWERWVLAAAPCYAVWQLLPLPLPVLGVVSPARAEIHAALAEAAGGGYAPLSLAPAATWEHLSRIGAYVLVFLLVREIAWRFSDRPWVAAFPLVAIAALEAALGIGQWIAGSPARGTYVNRNHFAGLLEMALPFAAMYAVAAIDRVRQSERRPGGQGKAGATLKACGALAASAVILVAIIDSLSRMGFVAALASLFVMGAIALGARRRRAGKWVAASAVAALVLSCFVFLPPDRLIARFAELAASEELSAGTRLQIWRETLQLIMAYPVFGCGLGGYESAFWRYKAVAPLNSVDYAHNDYLQALAEMGLFGFLIVAGIAGAAFRHAVRRGFHESAGQRYLGLACVGALAAIAVHSLVDFNLYIPASALVLAWIGGLASSPVAPDVGLKMPRVVEMRATRRFRDSTIEDTNIERRVELCD